MDALQSNLVALAPRAVSDCAPHGDRSDDDLLLLTRGGIQPAFDVLMKRHQTLALRVATRYLRDRSLAHDVAQQAFFEVFRGLNRYQPSGKFKPFLCRIIINQCRMYGRFKVCADRMTEQLVLQQELSSEQALVTEQRRDLEHALSRLNEKLRSVVILRYDEGLSLAEIAHALQLPIGTVKRRLFVALEKMRDLLNEDDVIQWRP